MSTPDHVSAIASCRTSTSRTEPARSPSRPKQQSERTSLCAPLPGQCHHIAMNGRISRRESVAKALADSQCAYHYGHSRPTLHHNAYSPLAMPPHLHPRSRWTTSLFTTTLLVSFLVVGMPHLLPCPAGPRAYAEGEMQGDKPRSRSRRRQKGITSAKEGSGCPEVDDVDPARKSLAAEMLDEGGLGRKRDCPMPRPSINLGGLLGFRNHDREASSRGEAGGTKKA